MQLHSGLKIVSDIAIFVLKRDVKLQLTNSGLKTKFSAFKIVSTKNGKLLLRPT